MYEITRMDNINGVIYVRDSAAGTYEYEIRLFFDAPNGKRAWDRKPDHISVGGCERLDGSGQSQLYVQLTDDWGNAWERVFMPIGGCNAMEEIL